MKRKYRNWIRKYVGDKSVAGLCGEYSVLMHATFPELIMIEGEYHEPDEQWPEGHCWLEDPKAGEIIDPTVSQFEEGGEYADGSHRFHGEVSEEMFQHAVRVAELICGEPLLPDNTWVAWEVQDLLDAWVERIEERRRDKKILQDHPLASLGGEIDDEEEAA